MNIWDDVLNPGLPPVQNVFFFFKKKVFRSQAGFLISRKVSGFKLLFILWVRIIRT